MSARGSTPRTGQPPMVTAALAACTLAGNMASKSNASPPAAHGASRGIISPTAPAISAMPVSVTSSSGFGNCDGTEESYPPFIRVRRSPGLNGLAATAQLGGRDPQHALEGASHVRRVRESRRVGGLAQHRATGDGRCGAFSLSQRRWGRSGILTSFVVRMQLAFSARSPGDQHRRPGAESAAGLVGPRRRARQEHTAMMPEPAGSAILVTMTERDKASLEWFRWASRIRAIAQTGLAYAKDPYDLDRYTELNSIAME